MTKPPPTAASQTGAGDGADGQLGVGLTNNTSSTRHIAMLGNPNTGKTTLFNRLCGLRAKTANLPGSTVEARIGRCTKLAGGEVSIVDLPGHYGLNLDRPESRVCKQYLAGELARAPRPDVVLIVADATNLSRNLMLASQALQQGLPAVVALNMSDIAQRRGLTIDVQRLEALIDCPVVAISAKSGQGVDQLVAALDRARISEAELPDPASATEAAAWAHDVITHSVGGEHAVGAATDTITDRLDAAFTHPIIGMLLFAAVISGVFYAIYELATVPMDLIDIAFTAGGAWLENVMAEGLIRDLLVNGVIAGIAGTVVFLPQICLLFFLLTLLEDTGYLARAAFVMDRLLRRFGLPGQSFVPLLSAHACAIPAIMSARLVPSHRDRLATILVAPFMSCSARVPVYVLMIGILFPDRALLAGLAFTGCYVLGALAAVVSSLILRRTILKGPSMPMVLELPSYKMPSLRTALYTTFDRAWVFLKQAGTVILCICVVLWWLGSYPRVDPPASAAALMQQAQQVEAAEPQRADELRAAADEQTAMHAQAGSFTGRIGRLVEPLMRPLGYDHQISIGVLSSFLAREVFVSTMTVVTTGIEDGDASEDETLRERLMTARRVDGSPLFTTATAASLLVFYVLAMQCLPTLAVTRRETGSWKWAMLQLVWMSGIAYIFALIMYKTLRAAGVV